jgi:hypothetical protein
MCVCAATQVSFLTFGLDQHKLSSVVNLDKSGEYRNDENLIKAEEWRLLYGRLVIPGVREKGMRKDLYIHTQNQHRCP